LKLFCFRSALDTFVLSLALGVIIIAPGALQELVEEVEGKGGSNRRRETGKGPNSATATDCGGTTRGKPWRPAASAPRDSFYAGGGGDYLGSSKRDGRRRLSATFGAQSRWLILEETTGVPERVLRVLNNQRHIEARGYMKSDRLRMAPSTFPAQ